MSARLRLAAEALFVLTEAFAWFVVLRTFSTLVERSALSDLADEVERRAGSGDVVDLTAAAEAARIARSAADTVIAGPALWSVVVAAFGAYFLTRFISRARIGGLGMAAGLLLSFLAVNLLLHLALAGDVRVWDNAGMARFIESPESPLHTPPDPVAFVANPDPASVEGRSYTLVVVGVVAMWLRFLWAGRGWFSFDRALRSFSMTFPAVLVAVFVASIASVGVGLAAISYFVLGVFSLALANAARSADMGEAFTHRAPWAVSVLATLAILAGVAALLSLLAALHAGDLFAFIGGGVMRVVSFLLVLVLTPVFWVVERVLGWAFGGADLSFLQRAADNFNAVNPDAEREGGLSLPGWIREALRLTGLALVAGVAYLMGRLIFRRFDRSDEGPYAEERGAVSGSGVGRLLRNLGPRRGGRDLRDARWIERQAAYRLYARAVSDSTERQFAPRAGETPLEFAGAASRALAALPFVPIAEQFDRARYGRHFASEAELRPLLTDLEAWETGNPITSEVRSRAPRGEEGPEIDVGPDIEPLEPADLPGGPLEPPV